jgi:hypothetical protein
MVEALIMHTHEWHEASHHDDSESLRKWIPIVVPLCAVALSALIFLIAAEVLYKP